MSTSHKENSELRGVILEAGNRFRTMEATLGGELVLTFLHPHFLSLDPGGASRDVLLPAEATDDGYFFIINNTADAAGENLVVKEDDDSTVVTTIGYGEMAWIWGIGGAGGAALDWKAQTGAPGSVNGGSAGVQIRAGTATLDGSNPTPVTTGLTTITGATVSLRAASTPGDDPSWLSHDVSDGTLNVYAWKNTGGTDPTLVASTNSTATFDWIAVGT